jgi:hypothetical protein
MRCHFAINTARAFIAKDWCSTERTYGASFETEAAVLTFIAIERAFDTNIQPNNLNFSEMIWFLFETLEVWVARTQVQLSSWTEEFNALCLNT